MDHRENDNYNAYRNYSPTKPNFPQDETHTEDSIRSINLHPAINSAVPLSIMANSYEWDPTTTLSSPLQQM